MKTSVLLLLLFIHSAFSEKRSLRIFSAGFSGLQNFPEHCTSAEVNGIEVFSTNSYKTLEKNQDQIKAQMQTDANSMDWIKSLDRYFEILPSIYYDMIDDLKQSYNHTEGVQVFQMISECGWVDQKKNVYVKSGYEGENFIPINSKTLMRRIYKIEPGFLKVRLDYHFRTLRKILSEVCCYKLQRYVSFTKTAHPRTVLPSVSLLQKSPSSPITCHATGFFPDRAKIFWRTDNKTLCMNRTILSNHDGSFQMSVDLSISSVKPQDWGKYKCVFQLSDSMKGEITKLQKHVIRTNYIAPHDVTIIISTIIAVAVVCCLIIAAYKIGRANRPESTPEKKH